MKSPEAIDAAIFSQTSDLTGGFQLRAESGQRHHKHDRFAAQRYRAVADIPTGGTLVLPIDDEQNAARLFRYAQTAPRSRREELAAPRD